MANKKVEKKESSRKPEEVAEDMTLEQKLIMEKEKWKYSQPRPVAREAVKMWITIPKVLLGQPESVLDAMGITDPDVRYLMRARFQRDLAKLIFVEEPTVSLWIKEYEVGLDNFKETKIFFKKLSSNLLAALYRKGLTEADAPRVKLYMQIIEDWKEQFSPDPISVTYKLDPEEKAMLDALLAKNAQ